MRAEEKRILAFLAALLLCWQTAAVPAFGDTADGPGVGETGEPAALVTVMEEADGNMTGLPISAGQSGGEGPADSGTWTYGTELRVGDHILLGAAAEVGISGGVVTPSGLAGEPGAVGGVGAGSDDGGHFTLPDTATGGYDFTLLDAEADGEEGGGLFLYSDPLGLSQMPQQFDKDDPSNPDEDSQADGYSLWTESDLYMALNGATKDGSTDTHGAAVAEARLFYERVSANPQEWEGLLPCETEGGDGEKVSLLSEREYEALRNEIDLAFWYTENQETGFWLKTAKGGDSYLVRYIYSNDIVPSLGTEEYYAYARKLRSVRPAVRLELEGIKFGAGSGTEDDPYRELSLRPRVESLEASGTVRVGGTLELTVSPAAADCSYQWYRKEEKAEEFALIPEATGSAFDLGPEDVGCMIRGEAKGSGEYVGTAEVTLGPVDKGTQKAPEGEEIPGAETVKITDKKITVVSRATASGLEYALVTAAAVTTIGAKTASAGQEITAGALAWSSAGAFTGLSAETCYELYVRRAELPAYYASPMAEPVTFTTKETGAEMTLTLHIGGFDPKRAAEVRLTMEPETASEAAVTLSAVSTTGSGVGYAIQTATLEGIAMDKIFSLEIRKPGHLIWVEPELSLTEDHVLEVKLPCGDVNGDGSIDLRDREILLSAAYYGKAVSEASGSGIGALLDLDGDGRIGWMDLCILMLKDNYGKRVRVR